MADVNQLRERRESIQRIQFGIGGLVVVLLIVTLANIMIRNARVDDPTLMSVKDGAVAPAANAAGGAPNTNEPLADLGVTPSSDASSAPAASDPAVATTPAVPDLEPDPKLATPMDRDPRQQAAPRR